MQQHKGPNRLNDIALHQIRRQQQDPNIAFIGGRFPTSVQNPDGNNDEAYLILWIARHDVLPDQPQPRALTLAPVDESAEAILGTLVEAILPSPESPLAPMMPNRIFVSDPEMVRIVRTGLRGVNVNIKVADEEDVALLHALAESITQAVSHQLHPRPWNADPALLRAVSRAAIAAFKKDPWSELPDFLPIAVQLDRYGLGTLYFATTSGNFDQQGLIAYKSIEDYDRGGRIGFLLSELEEVHGDINSLDQPSEDIALISKIIEHPDNALGDAFSIFYETIEAADPATQQEIERQHIVSHEGDFPNIMRLSREEESRRPTEDDLRGLTIALDAYAQFIARNRSRLASSAWYLGPISTTITVHDGEEAIAIPVSAAIPSATLEPNLRDRLLHLRIYPESQKDCWREITIRAQTRLDDVDDAILDAFDLPKTSYLFAMPGSDAFDDTYEIVVREEMLTYPGAPIGLMLRQARDHCLYTYYDEMGEESITFVIRLVDVGAKTRSKEPYTIVARQGELDLGFLYNSDDDEDDE
jgi:hypothetical protein